MSTSGLQSPNLYELELEPGQYGGHATAAPARSKFITVAPTVTLAMGSGGDANAIVVTASVSNGEGFTTTSGKYLLAGENTNKYPSSEDTRTVGRQLGDYQVCSYAFIDTAPKRGVCENATQV
jgi:hypothetical protein